MRRAVGPNPPQIKPDRGNATLRKHHVRIVDINTITTGMAEACATSLGNLAQVTR